ncbi:hypothetical protein F4678DRAFT_267066 [Xylaria arbuscula]|nr:hypothetical protein F4678DRAFT_267066 [Xylaria arbuscula]
MSHLTLRRSETPPGPQGEQQVTEEAIQDSPTIGRAAPDYLSDDLELLALPSTTPLTTTTTSTTPTATTTKSLANAISNSSLPLPFSGIAKPPPTLVLDEELRPALCTRA